MCSSRHLLLLCESLSEHVGQGGLIQLDFLDKLVGIVEGLFALNASIQVVNILLEL